MPRQVLGAPDIESLGFVAQAKTQRDGYASSKLIYIESQACIFPGFKTAAGQPLCREESSPKGLVGC